MKRKTLLSFVLLFFVLLSTVVLTGCGSKNTDNTSDNNTTNDVTKYTITWLNYDDTVLSTDNVDENTIPVYSGTTPIREASAEYTYIFDGWDKNIVNATADITYKATYRSNKNRYNVKFVDDNGDILISAIEYEYGTPAADIVKPNPTKSATPEYTYTFVGWNPAVIDVVGNQTYTAVYTNAKNKYTVTFKDEDGTILKDSKEYEYGTLAADIEKPADPIKESTLEYTYTFTGWTPEVNDVTGNVEYIATYRQDVRQYGVTFVDNNGQIIKDTTYYPYNTPIQNIIVPADPSTYYENNYKYDFAGWDKEISDVTEDVTYTATYNCIDLSYTQYSITFKDEDGSILKDATLYYYGTLASDIEKPNPTKESTVSHTYEFAGWTPEVEDVYHDAVYTATYNELVRQYSVTFVNDNGTIIKTALYDYNTPASNIEKPEDATKNSTEQFDFTFAGWTPSISDVTSDATYTATYTMKTRTYVITFVDEDGTLLQESTYAYGTKAAFVSRPTNPTKEADAQYTYTFDTWSPSVRNVYGDQTYTAVYRETLNKYKITFVNYDGTVLKAATEYDYGTSPSDIVYPENPTREADQQYTYTFVGWSPLMSYVTGSITYTATYNSTINKYIVTFVNDNGNILKEATEYEYGTPAADIDKPADPTKNSTEQFDFTFAGWTPSISDVTSDVTYKATYTMKTRTYVITFVDEDGTLLQESTYAYGTKAAFVSRPTNLTKPATAQYTYEFDSWSPSVMNVYGNQTYTAVYRATLNKYKITFVDYDGTVLKAATEYDYGTNYKAIEKPSNPTRAEDEGYTYSFTGWTPSLANVTEDMTYVATYTAYIRQYSVTFVNYDDTVLKETTLYDYGTLPADIEKPNNPTMPSTNTMEYEFYGWTPTISTVTRNVTYKATYTASYRVYYITFKDDDGTVLSNKGYTYGVSASSITKPADPTKESTAEVTYTFAGWTPTITDVDGDKTYTATYTQSTRQYGVTFVDYDGTVLKATKYYNYNTSYAYIAMPYPNPTREETTEGTYTFKGWSPEIQDVTCDLVYTATYTVTKKQYSITFKDEDGSILKAATLYDYGTVSSKIEKPSVSKASDDEYTHAFAGWTPSVQTVTEDAIYTATYVKNKKYYTVTFEFYEGYEVYFHDVWGTSFEAPTAPSRKGYRFIGWDETVPTTIPTYDLYISAIWEDVYFSVTATSNSTFVTYEIEGGTSHKEDETVTIKVSFPKGYDVTVKKDGGTITLNSNNQYSFTMPASNVSFVITSKPYTRYGDTVYFGSYPFVKVVNQNTITNLNNQAGTLPTAANSQNWTSYRYRDGSTASDYMWYIDLTDSDGEKYRGVYFTKYRPTTIGDAAGTSSSYVSSNGYNLNTVYWFKYEAITWQVLEEENGEVLMISKYILDSQPFQNTSSETVSTNGGTTAANNYVYSNLRSFLNTTSYTSSTDQVYNNKSFQNYAINTEQRNIIVKTVYTLNESTTYADYFGILRTSYTEYFSGLKAVATEYAKIQGLQCVTSSNISYGNYWTSNSYYPTSVVTQGKYVYTYNTSGTKVSDKKTDNTSIGVRPAVRIKL